MCQKIKHDGSHAWRGLLSSYLGTRVFLRPSFEDVVHTVPRFQANQRTMPFVDCTCARKNKNYEKAKFFISIADAVYHVTTGIGNAEFGENTNWQ